MNKPDSHRIRAITDNAFGDEVGCHDGGCIYGHRGGMQTNGGCQCLKSDGAELRRHLQRIARIARLALYVERQPV